MLYHSLYGPLNSLSRIHPCYMYYNSNFLIIEIFYSAIKEVSFGMMKYNLENNKTG